MADVGHDRLPLVLDTSDRSRLASDSRDLLSCPLGVSKLPGFFCCLGFAVKMLAVLPHILWEV